MLVLINSNSTYWRLHITQGLLEAHGVRCCIWHDHSAALYAGDGVLKCSLAIEEADFEDAAEVLNSPAGELPEMESDQASEQPMGNIYPDFAILLFTGLMLTGLFGLLMFTSSNIATLLNQHVQMVGPRSGGISTEQLVAMIACWLLSGLLWAGSTLILLLPLKWREDSQWSFLWAYLFGRWIFPWLVLVPLSGITWLFVRVRMPIDPFRVFP